MLHSVDQSPYVSDCALQTKFLKKVQKGDHIFVHSKSRLCPSLSCFSLSVYSLSGIFCYCERIVKKRLKLWYPIYFVFYQNRGVQPFCYCRPPGPQPTDIFGGGAKWCNLLLHLTNTHVCENFGGGQLLTCPLWLRVCRTPQHIVISEQFIQCVHWKKLLLFLLATIV